ncbi:DeoR/GlpR family DNA-binding transcription regulator [Paenibacillus ginsengarvi]|uniref:DeoR/GlpR transcriptional regulator n=1 Tax=Paenibacillus ginsengarvi TaxID=400777 RepID=A0A3B0CJP7_9BACL|nr:DeoR/GlpR family DNA-binding transcription regulator [Paenibacillus ginsengarvi]RKN84226.1 DeoR/GlpR transcriptional regulator [Paenibacillus ginsengarvi]
MRLQLNERQNDILTEIQRDGEVKISDLKERYEVTDMTIRRDLEKLESLGLVRRTFGGAIPVTLDVSLKERDAVHTDEKVRIGKAAAGLVQPHEAIFIDGGTTTLQVAHHLDPDSSITVVTNALNVATVLLDKGIHTIVAGGTLLEKTGSMIGPIAIGTLASMAFDQVFLGTTGMTAEHGFSNSNSFEAELKRQAMKRAAKVTVVADGSKFGERYLHSFASMKDVHRVVTDREPQQAIARAAADAGLTIIVASF